ncbi:Dcp1-like decapping family protein [Necator americanus]|uniref:Dcp1-like decapping family protein n=1 Tax=Necator americanus TaxID=51031 RepID=W2TCV8_NECAM|nr:Dcp1-like decapping family protein [Necator americanus]ETN79429.1 Dcp1-like decapping family protein [Necator americanus]
MYEAINAADRNTATSNSRIRLIANMEQKSKADPSLTARNLCSIQRIDPCAVAIIDKATHAAKYNFDVTAKAWTKTNIEGALFIIQRADKPYYSLIIANRQSLDDMVEPVNPLTKMNLEGHYLFFCKPDKSLSNVGVALGIDEEQLNPSTDQIYGLWFFSTEDCSRLYNLLKKLQEEIRSGKIPTPPANDDVGSSNVPESVAPPNESNQLLDLLKSTQTTPSVQEMYTSASAASLAALSNRSVHGSDGEADANEVESIVSSRAPADDSTFAICSGSTTPPLNKLQFASALIHLMQTDDHFLTQIHQAYVDAINRRINGHAQYCNYLQKYAFSGCDDSRRCNCVDLDIKKSLVGYTEACK